MKLEEAQQKRLLVYEHQTKLRVEIDTLKDILVGYGVEPDQRFVGLKSATMKYINFTKKKFHLPRLLKNTIYRQPALPQICHRIDHDNAKKKVNLYNQGR